MIKIKNNSGYLQILSLLIVVAIILFLVYFMYLKKDDDSGKTQIEENISAIEEAEDVKDKIESRNMIPE